ncbi:MAG: UMP kinase [bacterium]
MMEKYSSGFEKIMLKVSGEALGGEGGFGIHEPTVNMVAYEISKAVKIGKRIGVVIGAGNFFRGITGVSGGMDRVTADYMGMMATIMNALALREAIRGTGIGAEVLSAIEVGRVAKFYDPQKGRRLLEKGTVVICAAGTGNPYFTTDTAAVLRALELNCDVVLKATKVDGVYDKDPMKFPDAVKFDKIAYAEVLEKKLGVMDLTAVTLAMEGKMPIVVFRLAREDSITHISKGDFNHSTLIWSD